MNNILLKKRILVLERDSKMTTAIDALLSSNQWDVCYMYDPNTVYDRAISFRPHLIILDYRLIDQDCAMICQEFKEDPAFNKVPIFIVTSFKNKKINEQAYLCDALFVKPLDFDVLASRMDLLMAS